MTTERTPSVSPSLSERELEVLKLVATGATNNQVARELSISVNTVKVHLNNIFAKLGVQSRTEASLYAVRHGWIEMKRPDGSVMPAATQEAAGVFEAATPVVPELLEADRRAAPPNGAASGPLASALTPAPAHGRRWRWGLAALAIILVAAFPVYLFASSTPQWKSLFPPVGSVIVPPLPLATPPARWQFRAPLSSPREAMAVTTLNGQIYVAGGLSGGAPVTTVEVYDPPTDHWSARASKPTALQGAGAAVIGGHIYVPGGCDASDRPSNVMEVYDPQADSWEPGASLPQALCHFAIATLEGKLYLFGGWDGSAAVADVRVFDPVKGEWSAQAPLPGARMDAAAAVVDDRIYVAGGRDGKRLIDQVLEFNPAQLTGSSQAWSLRTTLSHPRADLALASLAGNLYVVGGGWSEALAQNERFDTRTNSWQVMEADPEVLWRVGGAAALETKIYVLGGWKGGPTAALSEYTALYRYFLPNAP